MNYTRHPLSAAWPNMSAEEYASLIESIQMHGQRDPIVLLDGEILDGWHRYRACVEAGMEPVFTAFEGDDPKDFVSDKHNRRSLNLTQRMTAIALMNEWAPSHRPRKVEVTSTLTNAALAKQAGGSTKTAQQVKAAISKGTKEVVKGMQDGTLSAERASKIAQLPAKEQAKALKAPKPEAEDIHYVGPSEEEIAVAQESAAADQAAFEVLLAADDKLAAAVEEIKKLKLQLAAVESQRDGYMNRSNELIARITTLKRRLAKAEAAHV